MIKNIDLINQEFIDKKENLFDNIDNNTYHDIYKYNNENDLNYEVYDTYKMSDSFQKEFDNQKSQELSDNLTSLVRCWHIKRNDGIIIGFTEYDCDIKIDGIKYIARSGNSASAFLSSMGCKTDNMDITCALNNDLITSDDIIAGKYDFAEIISFILDLKKYYKFININQNFTKNKSNIKKNNTNSNNTNSFKFCIKKGIIGKIEIHGQQFIAEVKGLTQNFLSDIGEVYSPLCRVKFCDKKCSLKIEKYLISDMIISGLESYSIFKSQSLHDYFTNFSNLNTNNFFNLNNDSKNKNLLKIISNGYIKFKSGKNINIEFEIKSVSYKGEIMLHLAPFHQVNLGDLFDIYCGCDKSFSTCSKVFNNALNFRGEPHIPSPNDIISSF
ncbi:DUF2163 domain-containing protein [Lyticum sinuosum]|uniref:DUF2163 domain-containing prophage protein n=1 Tax=Lyticum sinuosum TaxID=1332059 RepID=A0AAE4VJ22_9RICK|nr:DUF2163 domain-containing protein [Lyticum sinuosum]MDZ5760930.1 putative DUF2163 domain-containing prophage protein [Lyticum sinuosum]